ncbi:hypothetical protein Gotri_014976 [Gossypium trilobum]|uniref:Uncharacterized protein n=1 Tax=Gossypium trilobum TaxID=34281 RepID=A0A7J9DZV3_9ROSI|nr:hypothetical protein [Gossypium trilobum]
MHLLEKFARFDLDTSRYEENSLCLRLEYLRVGHLPKALGHIDDAV